MAFVKLDCAILDSTLWLSNSDVRVVFLTMLTMATAKGMCEATAPGIARRANLSLETTRAAIAELESPDPESKSMAEEGRRILRVDGGYWLVNYEKYRQKDHTAAERMRRFRSKHKEAVTRNDRNKPENVTPVTRNVTYAYAEADTEAKKKKNPPTEGKKKKPSAPDFSVLPAVDDRVLADFREHRRRKKAPLTQTAINRLASQLRQCEAEGITPTEALSETMDAGWTSLKPEWIKRRLGGPQSDDPFVGAVGYEE